MRQLTGERCVACRSDSPHVNEEETTRLLPELPQWQLVTENQIRRLRRTFRFPDFIQALSFTDMVGEAAEAEGHHPRLTTEWGRVTVTWWTHKIRDLHRNDFIMAAKSDQLYIKLTQGT